MTKQPLLLTVIMFSFAFHVAAQDCILTKEINLMSDSDMVSIQNIPYFYAEGNGGHALWNFTDCISDGRSQKKLLRKDPRGRYVVMSSRDKTYYRLDNDTLFIVGRESNLSKTDYKYPQLCMHYPLSYGDSLSMPFIGYGVYCGDHLFREQGVSTVMGDAAGSIVLGVDTILNVLRVYTLKSYSLCMDMDSAALDTARRKQVIEERCDWYARGYRYPIFTTVTSTSYDGMQALGTLQKAFCMLPDAQRQLDDSLNQDIRRSDSTEKARGTHTIEDIFHYTVSYNGGQVTVSYSLDRAADITALLSDVAGIPYRHSHVHNDKGNGYAMRIDCSGLRSGHYILYMNVSGKVYSENIAIKQ